MDIGRIFASSTADVTAIRYSARAQNSICPGAVICSAATRLYVILV